MDACGIDVQVLSLNAPGIQAESDPGAAVRAAAQANDALARIIADHPGRFSGFAALPLQDPARAVAELTRAVTVTGLRGALVNGHTHGVYLDDPSLWPVWERAQDLGVPLYLHPATSYDTWHVLRGREGLIGPAWSWGAETAAHALRVVVGGTFDRFPGATMILGHMGETLPYVLGRLDNRWAIGENSGPALAPSAYFRRNVMITTSGVHDPAPLRAAITVMGAERVMFATDYPFERAQDAVAALRNAPVTEKERTMISHGNAAKLLGL
jgi:2,3-dihydroxybenzoate decarboxylase